MQSSLVGEIFLNLSACGGEKETLGDTLTWAADQSCRGTNPFNSKLLYLVVLPLEQLLHIFENSAGSIQVPRSSLTHWKQQSHLLKQRSNHGS